MLTLHKAPLHVVNPIQAPSLEEQTARLLTQFLSGKRGTTLRAYKTDLTEFQNFIGAESFQEAATRLLSCGHGEANALAIAWKSSLLDRGFAPATINRRIAALRSLVSLARTFGIVPWHLEIKNVKGKKYKDTKGPGYDKVDRAIASAQNRQDAKGIRDAAILSLALFHGLRRAEISELDMMHIDLEGKRISIYGKARRERDWVNMPDETIQLLTQWIEVRGTEPGPLFIELSRNKAGGRGRLSPGGIWKICKSFGFGVHGIRHSAITKLIEMGVPLTDVQDFSRHADLNTLMIYRDNTHDGAGKASKALAALSSISKRAS